jgi:hypothetical protein
MKAGIRMKTAAIICLAVGIAAAAVAIVLQSLKIKKAGKADKRSIGTIVFAAVYIVVAALNFVFVLPNL